MAAKPQTDYFSGATLDGLIWAQDGTIWNGSAFEAYSAGNYANYVRSMQEKGSSGHYEFTSDFPAGIAKGRYYIQFKSEKNPGTPAQTDDQAGGKVFDWSGTAEEGTARQTIEALIATIADAVLDEVVNAGNHNGVDSLGFRLKAIYDKLPTGFISDFDESLNKVNLNNDQSGATIGTVNNLGANAKGHVNAEVVDAVAVDQIPELTGVPSATPTMRQAIMFLLMAFRNTQTATASEQKVHNSAGVAIAKANLSTDGVTTQKEKFGAP